VNVGGRQCGNDPRAVLTPGDRAAVSELLEYLAARAGDAHRWEGAGEDWKRCPECGVSAVRHRSREYGPWVEYRMPSGWSWHAADGVEGPPPCPPPPVEALCPWDWTSMRYAGAKGDDQLDTAMRTWCVTHERAVSECVDPGPVCPGALAHEEEGQGVWAKCTGREDTCRCRCSACCGDTPDVYGYDGDY
jgi:hypothetical protein